MSFFLLKFHLIFYFLLIFFFFFESQVPKPVPYYAVQTRTDGEKLCWKGLWRATEKRNMTTQCVTHQLAAATSPSPQELRMEAARGAQKEQAHCRRGRGGGGAIREHWLRLCCLENRNQEWGSSSASKREINPKASLQNAELHPERSHMGTGNRHSAASLKEWPLHISTPPFRSCCI